MSNEIDWSSLTTREGFSSTEEMLRSLYKDSSLRELSERLGVSTNTLRKALKLYGVKIRSPGGPNNTGRGKSVLDDYDKNVFDEYSVEEIARMAGVHPSTVYKYKKRLEDEE